jgi:hypothetical protein
VLLTTLGPVGEQARGVLDETTDPLQALLRAYGVSSTGTVAGPQALDAQLRQLLLLRSRKVWRTIGALLCGSRKPVAAGRRALAEDDLEVALGIQ